ncbi:spore germination protein D [Oikeobacillus pervagus]|uniref:Spore germination protein D n=1 Tax=Oikeobacillus pervagus TaxID=1325931 RepID=A0AAJ1WLG4_9BACI|nr:spore germination lipoprotein GerD [Oikeobacillus pervagus]MDQ0216166.1 spore germination protein D [Oikeobacillus pervagus]
MRMIFVPLLLVVFFLSACAEGGETGGGQMDYDQTKKMIVDILKSDQGKQAIQEILKDEKVKQELVMDSGVVTEAIKNSMTNEKGEEFWKKSFSDPKFSEAIAKSMKKENEQLLKDLMKDPEYQEMMLSIMNDPEFKKELSKLVKSKEYREHLQKVITETFESPLYKAKIQDILLKAATEQVDKDKKEQGGEEQGGQSDQQGGQDQQGGGGG